LAPAFAFFFDAGAAFLPGRRTPRDFATPLRTVALAMRSSPEDESRPQRVGGLNDSEPRTAYSACRAAQAKSAEGDQSHWSEMSGSTLVVLTRGRASQSHRSAWSGSTCAARRARTSPAS